MELINLTYLMPILIILLDLFQRGSIFYLSNKK